MGAGSRGGERRCLSVALHLVHVTFQAGALSLHMMAFALLRYFWLFQRIRHVLLVTKNSRLSSWWFQSVLGSGVGPDRHPCVLSASSLPHPSLMASFLLLEWGETTSALVFQGNAMC